VELNGGDGEGGRDVDAFRNWYGQCVVAWNEDGVRYTLKACPDVCAQVLSQLVDDASYGISDLH
jgi:hypothetical protein